MASSPAEVPLHERPEVIRMGRLWGRAEDAALTRYTGIVHKGGIPATWHPGVTDFKPFRVEEMAKGATEQQKRDWEAWQARRRLCYGIVARASRAYMEDSSIWGFL